MEHQFKKKMFYLPKWEVEYLFIGTFNPSEGKKVPYYYGRKKNRFWKLLSEVFKIELDPNDRLFFENLKSLKVDHSTGTNYDTIGLTCSGYQMSNIFYGFVL